MTVDLKRLSALADGLRKQQQTVAERPTRKSWFDISNAAGDTTSIYIYDMIGEWGVTSADFVSELVKVRSPKLNVHINSEGGAVFDGIAIYTALVEHPAEVTTIVDGLAASAASFIAQAGNTRKVAKNGRLMIHNAQGVCMGDEVDAEEFVRMLKDLSENIADIYAERSGQGDRATWRARMSANRTSGTWFSAEQALEAGLADEILGQPKVSNKAPATTAGQASSQAADHTGPPPAGDDLLAIFRVFQEV